MRPRQQGRPPARIAAGAALGLSGLAAGAIAAWPCAYRGSSTAVDSAGSTTVTRSCSSFVEVNGAGILWVLAIPVALSALVFAAAWVAAATLARAGATVLALFSLLAGFSVGLFFVPAALASVLAAVLTGRRLAEG